MQNRKITEYMIVSGARLANNANDLEEALWHKVENLISEGWQPYGSPFIRSDVDPEIYQAMVRYEDEH